MMPKVDEYLTVKQAAEYVGISPNTLRNWGRDGKIAEHRNPVNGYRLYQRSDLDRLLLEIERSARHTPRRKPR